MLRIALSSVYQEWVSTFTHPWWLIYYMNSILRESHVVHVHSDVVLCIKLTVIESRWRRCSWKCSRTRCCWVSSISVNHDERIQFDKLIRGGILIYRSKLLQVHVSLPCQTAITCRSRWNLSWGRQWCMGNSTQVSRIWLGSAWSWAFSRLPWYVEMGVVFVILLWESKDYDWRRVCVVA